MELKISVQDVNNHAPEFDAPWYAFDVDEGDAEAHPREIARLFARDADCGHPYGKVLLCTMKFLRFFIIKFFS